MARRPWFIGSVGLLIMLAGSSWASCTSDDAHDSEHTAGAGGGASASTAVTSSSSSAGGGAPDACPAEIEGDCGACMESACCEVAAACQDDASCWACVTGADGDACEITPETHERVDKFLVCRGGPCQQACIGAGGGMCEGLLDGALEEACEACLEKSCCDEVAACHDNDICWDGCLNNHDPEVCHSDPDGHALYHALSACASGSCEAECFPPAPEPACDAPAEAPSTGACVMLSDTIKCNPVTNEGCDAAAGEACDAAQGGGFVCYLPPPANDVAICQPCSAQVGWCAPGHVCVGTCARYCCDDGDCGAGVCDKTLIAGGLVGACVAKTE